MDWCSRPLVFLVLVVFLLSASTSRSQRTRPPSGAAVPVPAPAPAPSPDTFCNGVYLSYVLEQREKIHPFTSNPADQPYAFRATATVLNHGTADLLAWTLLVPFCHRELIVSVGGGVLSNGSAFPYNTTLDANSTASPQEMKPDATVALRVQGRKDRHEATGLILHNCTISADASLVPAQATASKAVAINVISNGVLTGERPLLIIFLATARAAVAKSSATRVSVTALLQRLSRC